MTCPLCSGSHVSDMFNLDKRVAEESFTIKKCNTCLISWTDPVPDNEQLSSYYPDEYHGKGGQERFNPLMELFVGFSRRKRAAIVNAFNMGKAGRILDIGCGRGVMLSLLKKKGWQVFGTELSKKSSAFARERYNVDVKTKDISECEFSADSFDMITMWHVLEHLPKPLLTLINVNRILKDDGKLIVEVPNFGGLQAKLFGNKWFHLDSPRHIFHFNEESLKKYLAESGFDIVKEQNLSWEYDPFGFIQSTLNLFCFHFDSFYNFLRSGSGKLIPGARLTYVIDIILTFILLPLLLPFSFFASFLSSLFNKGGVIRLYCVKRKNH